MEEDVKSSNRELNTWKEIGDYLGVTEKTARKWAREGMPVHQMPGDRKGRVVAFVVELEDRGRGLDAIATADASGFVHGDGEHRSVEPPGESLTE